MPASGLPPAAERQPEDVPRVTFVERCPDRGGDGHCRFGLPAGVGEETAAPQGVGVGGEDPGSGRTGRVGRNESHGLLVLG